VLIKKVEYSKHATIFAYHRFNSFSEPLITLPDWSFHFKLGIPCLSEHGKYQSALTPE
jgi:hypothetical protein